MTPASSSSLRGARVLAERGFARATIATVAAEAGIAPGLVHHHFDSECDVVAARCWVGLFAEAVRNPTRGMGGELWLGAHGYVG